jgi:hypothetical protein
MVKHILFFLFILTSFLACNNQDDLLLFTEKYDMTLWKDRENSCGPMAPLYGQPYIYTRHYFIRFEKNHNGYLSFIEPSYPEASCEQEYWACWQVRRAYVNMADNEYIEIVSQTEDFINYNFFFDKESSKEDWPHYNIQMNINDGVLRLRIEDCCGRIKFTSYVKSDIDFNSLDLCE